MNNNRWGFFPSTSKKKWCKLLMLLNLLISCVPEMQGWAIVRYAHKTFWWHYKQKTFWELCLTNRSLPASLPRPSPLHAAARCCRVKPARCIGGEASLQHGEQGFLVARAGLPVRRRRKYIVMGSKVRHPPGGAHSSSWVVMSCPCVGMVLATAGAMGNVARPCEPRFFRAPLYFVSCGP
jgi:hypothetical protein